MKFKRTKVVVTTFMLSAALVAAGMPAAAFADDTDELQQRVNEAYATLQSYTTELEQANAELETVKQNLSDVQEQITQTQSDIDAKKAEVADGQKVISDRLSTTYKQGNANLLTMVLGASSFDDLFSRVFYANKVADADAAVVAQVKSDVEELKKKEEELAEQEAQQKQLVSDQETKTAEVSSKLNQQQSYYNGLDTQLKEQLAQEAARKAAEEAARQQAEQAAKEQQNANSGNSSNNGSNGGANSGNTNGGNTGSNNSDNSGSGNNGNNNSNNNTNKPSKPSDNGNTNSGNAPSSVVSAALAQVGKPYVWGAGGPNAFDCSGLTSYAYAQVGYSIPHQSQQQYNMVKNKGHLVYNIGSLKAGDLVFWGTGGSGSSIYHVGIYIGNGQYVHASMPGVGVVAATLYTGGNYVGGGSPV